MTTTARRHPRSISHSLGTIALHIVLIAAGVIALAPLWWMVVTSLKNDTEQLRIPPTFYPHSIRWSNFSDAFSKMDFGRYFVNTVLYAGVTTVLTLALCSMAGYGFARLHFRGRDVLFYAVIATIMIPGETHLIPNFLIIKQVPFVGGNNWYGSGGSGLIDTFPGLILPGIVTPMGIFLMRQFLSGFPIELEDAARVDGASTARIFLRIVLPNMVPPLATLGILTFVGTWNGFTWPLIITASDTTRTLQLGLQVFQSNDSVPEWGLLMAGTVMTVTPLIVLFLLAQRYFVNSLALSGLK